MLFMLFAFGGLFWWLLILGASALIVLGLDQDKPRISTAVLIGAFLALFVFGDAKETIWPYIRLNPTTILMYALGYLAIGGVYGVYRWWVECTNRNYRFEDFTRNFLRGYGITGTKVSDELKPAFVNAMLDSEFKIWNKAENSYIPNVQIWAWDNKGRIIAWMTYWPWSLVWHVIDDFVRRIFRRLYQCITSILDGITKRVFAKGTENYSLSPEMSALVKFCNRGWLQDNILAGFPDRLEGNVKADPVLPDRIKLTFKTKYQNRLNVPKSPGYTVFEVPTSFTVESKTYFVDWVFSDNL